MDACGRIAGAFQLLLVVRTLGNLPPTSRLDRTISTHIRHPDSWYAPRGDGRAVWLRRSCLGSHRDRRDASGHLRFVLVPARHLERFVVLGRITRRLSIRAFREALYRSSSHPYAPSSVQSSGVWPSEGAAEDISRLLRQTLIKPAHATTIRPSTKVDGSGTATAVTVAAVRVVRRALGKRKDRCSAVRVQIDGRDAAVGVRGQAAA